MLQVFGKRICEELGFKSENAQKMMFNCKDHHKTWRFLEALLFGFLDESLSLYKKSKTTQANACDYLEWLKQQPENHRFISSMIFDYLFGVMLLRISIRRNCFDGISLSFLLTLKVLIFARTNSHAISRRGPEMR